MSCCTYECTGGHGCPVRDTKITVGPPQPQERSSWDVIGDVVFTGLYFAAVIATVVCLAAWAFTFYLI